jgi:hypothetical protein
VATVLLFNYVENLFSRGGTMARKTAAPIPTRAVYDPAIREVINRGELGEMEDMLLKAKVHLQEHGDVKAAVVRLQAAIKKARP